MVVEVRQWGKKVFRRRAYDCIMFGDFIHSGLSRQACTYASLTQLYIVKEILNLIKHFLALRGKKGKSVNRYFIQSFMRGSTMRK